MNLPYADATSKSEEEVGRQMERRRAARVQPHAGGADRGQIEAGFLSSGFYEDRHRDDPIAAFMPTFVATQGDQTVTNRRNRWPNR